ncbi:hypothetical protein CK203_019843 [Vitis vinifera]|uniref:DUF4283 domain-containing protein n=1 Tax=Vitis vinifera TaxID=29760 RepID=A0A438J2Y5_VITVI|nr:hypothetical protein CK203_019843 [Vitis vinifera]
MDAEDEKGPDLRVVEIWANTQWSFCGGESPAQRGSFIPRLVGSNYGVFKSGVSEGCFLGENPRAASSVLVHGVLQKSGDTCGGFVDVDEETKKSRYRRGRVNEKHYGGGNPAAGVGDRVTGWEIQIPEDKAGKKEGGGLVSLQEVTGLVKESPDAAKGGAAEVIRKDKMKLFEKGRSIVAGKAGKDGQAPNGLNWRTSWEGLPALGCPAPTGPKSFEGSGGRWVGSTRPNRSKEGIKGSAQFSPRAPFLCCWGEQGGAPDAARGIVWPFFFFSFSPEMGDTMGISQSRQLEETIEDPLETELPLCISRMDVPSLCQIIGVGEKENDKSPWINKKFLGFCKSVGVSIEGFEEDILRILKEIENRRCFIRKSNEKKRGTLSGSRKERELKKLVSTINYDGVAGRETEEGELGRQMTVGCQELGIGRNLGWVSLDARGAAGGVLVMWDKRVLEGLEFEVGSFSISCRFRNCEEGFVWVFSGLYGPSKGRERRELWEELAAIKGLWNDPWCIAGDFNVVRFPAETSNGRQMSTAMREFSSFIDEFELVDPPLGVELSLG